LLIDSNGGGFEVRIHCKLRSLKFETQANGNRLDISLLQGPMSKELLLLLLQVAGLVNVRPLEWREAALHGDKEFPLLRIGLSARNCHLHHVHAYQILRLGSQDNVMPCMANVEIEVRIFVAGVEQVGFVFFSSAELYV